MPIVSDRLKYNGRKSTVEIQRDAGRREFQVIEVWLAPAKIGVGYFKSLKLLG